VAGLLLVVAFVGVTRSSHGDHRKHAARWLVVAVWHGAGLLVAAYCLVVVLHTGGILGPVPAAIVAGYDVVGLIPLAVVLPQSGWPRRVKAALAAGGAAGLVIALLGLPLAGGVVGAAGFVAAFILPGLAIVLPWALLVPLVLACAVAVVATSHQLIPFLGIPSNDRILGRGPGLRLNHRILGKLRRRSLATAAAGRRSRSGSASKSSGREELNHERPARACW
jgi:hypothetical protein